MSKQAKAKAKELQKQVVKLRSAHKQMVDLAERAEKCAVELSHVLDGAEKELATARMEAESEPGAHPSPSRHPVRPSHGATTP